MNDFRSDVSKLIAPGLNFIYADSTGNIAWYGAAKLVKRPNGVAGNRILNGADSTNEWLGYYDFSENPIHENPACGFVFSCNNQPDSVHGIAHEGYYLTDDRALRLKDLLQQKPKYDLKDVQQICLDHTNPTAASINKLLLQNIEPGAVAKCPAGDKMLALLKNWKGSHQTDESAPIVYYTLLYKTLYKALADDMGDKDFQAFLKTHAIKFATLPLLQNENAIWWDDTKTAEHETRSKIITAAFEATASDIVKNFGDDPNNWRWEKMHLLEFKHPVGKMKPLNHIFNVGPMAVPGGAETINNQSFNYTDQFPVTVAFGPALRRCLDFSNPENGYSVSPSGQSGNPMSKHYADQAAMYATGKFRKEMMNKKEIESNCKDVIIFNGK